MNRPWLKLVLPLVLPLVLLAACGHPDQADLRQLEQFPKDSDATVAQAAIACDAADPVCSRLWLYKGAACARLAEAP